MSFDKKDIINRMTEIREELSSLVEEKHDSIEKMKDEIEILTQRVKHIDQFISENTKFNTAYKLLNEKDLDEEDNENINRVDQRKRKIYSHKDSKIFLIQMEIDGTKIELFFPNPQITKLKPVDDLYLKEVIHPLIQLKEKEELMEINIEKKNSDGIITKLLIENVKMFENREKIFEIFNNLAKKISSSKK